MPIINWPKYLSKPPMASSDPVPPCLRYIIWALGATLSDQHTHLAQLFYTRSRKYAQLDEMSSYGESSVTLAHVQTWVLISQFEIKMVFFPRAWPSIGKAVRLAQMQQLHRLDEPGLQLKGFAAGGQRDWSDIEERRRTFWLAFCLDRWGSMGTGWPMILDESDVSPLSRRRLLSLISVHRLSPISRPRRAPLRTILHRLLCLSQTRSWPPTSTPYPLLV